MKHVAGEPHLRRTERIIGGEAEDGRKHSSFKTGILRTPETQRAGSDTEQRTWRDRTTSPELSYQSGGSVWPRGSSRHLIDFSCPLGGSCGHRAGSSGESFRWFNTSEAVLEAGCGTSLTNDLDFFHSSSVENFGIVWRLSIITESVLDQDQDQGQDQDQSELCFYHHDVSQSCLVIIRDQMDVWISEHSDLLCFTSIS